MRQTEQDRVENPVPVVGTKPAMVNREFWCDPAYVFIGELITKFSIKASPAVALQEALLLKIEEQCG